MKRVCLAAAFAAGLVAPALSATPPDTQMMGSMQSVAAIVAADGETCSVGAVSDLYTRVDGNGSWFKRNGTGTAQIYFPPVIWSGPQWSQTVQAAGFAQLRFSTRNSGLVRFPYLAPDKALPVLLTNVGFSQYGQSWDATTQTLQVAFILTFGHCSMPISATYAN